VIRKGQAVVIGAVVIIVAVVIGAVVIAVVWSPGQAMPTLVPVTGVVRIDGKPLKKVAVRFVPKDDYGPDYIAFGVTDEEGRYTLLCKNRPGACVGENQVLILETPPPQLPRDTNGHPNAAPYYKSLGGRPVPLKYANLGFSPLTADVQAGHTKYDFDLLR
jgi:hypothetical protein